MTHTPGPWKVVEATAYDHGEPSPYVAVMSEDATVIDWPDLKPANARLIAAAPELLEAAKRSIIVTRSDEVADARLKLIAAINKAEVK